MQGSAGPPVAGMLAGGGWWGGGRRVVVDSAWGERAPSTQRLGERAPGSTGSAGRRMAEQTSLRDAVAALIHDGDTVAMEGFTHLIPFAAGHEVIRQGRRGLTLIRMT